MLLFIGFLLVALTFAELDPSDRPVLIRLQPQPRRPNFMKESAAPGQQFIPREIVTPPPPPPINIPTDVQNQLIKFFGLDSFGIPGLTGNHPNGFAGAIQELRAAGFPVQDVLTQANPAFGNQLNQLYNEASGPTSYHGAGSIPLPEATPGENGLIGLLS
uniref:Uncharacterized protein n=1 Tax=Parascaris equorum TaxID=6256 RepID=A0A914RER1_PAREQ